MLIEDLNIVEKAGEEGDKYTSFKLVQISTSWKKPVIRDAEIIVDYDHAAKIPIVKVK